MELHACYFKDLGAFSTDQRRASATAGKLEPGRLVSAIGLLIPQCRPGRTTKTPRLQGNLSRRSRSYGHSMGVNTPARKSALAAGPKRAWIGRTITTLEDTPIPPAADPPGTTTPGPVDGLRLRWRDPGSSDEYIDGGWWPRSLDLSTELPPLRRGDAAREVLMLRAREDMVMPVGPAPHPTLANLVEHRPDAGAARCHRAEHFRRPGRAAARGGAASLTSSRCSGSAPATNRRNTGRWPGSAVSRRGVLRRGICSPPVRPPVGPSR